MKANKYLIFMVIAIILFAVKYGPDAYGYLTKPKFECMRSYYAGMDIEMCSANIRCSKSSDETGSMKICMMEQPK